MNSSRAPRTWFLLAFVFLVLAVYGSLVPLDFREVSFHEAVQQFRLGLKNWSFGGSGVDWGTNVLLFVPISFCLLCAVSPPGSLSVSRGVALLAVVTFCAMATLAIEFTQNWFQGRVSSASDVFAQLLGTGLGATAWLIVGDAATYWLDGYLRDKRPNKQLDWLVQAYVIGLLLYSVTPFDLTMRPAELYAKYKANRIWLVPFRYDYGSAMQLAYQMATDVAVCIPVGLLASTVLTSARRPLRPVPASFAVGICVVVGMECAQLLVWSRVTDATDLITGTTGVGIGIWIMQHWRGESAESEVFTQPIAWKWLAVGILYSIVLAVLFWAPFDFVTDRALIKEGLSGFFVVPLSSAVGGARFAGFTAILRKVIFFVPLGVFIALGTASLGKHARRIVRILLFLCAGALALVIELGQIALPNRTATFDDALICAAGALAGLLLTSRIVNASA